MVEAALAELALALEAVVAIILVSPSVFLAQVVVDLLVFVLGMVLQLVAPPFPLVALVAVAAALVAIALEARVPLASPQQVAQVSSLILGALCLYHS